MRILGVDVGTTSMKMGGLPLGLAHNVKVVRPVQKGRSLSWDDVAMDTGTRAWQVRQEMETMFPQQYE